MSLSKYHINLKDEIITLETLERVLKRYGKHQTEEEMPHPQQKLLSSLQVLIRQKKNNLLRAEGKMDGVWVD